MLPGFAGHWSLNTNPAWAFDVWFLNLFRRRILSCLPTTAAIPRLSFIPTLGTMILGLITGSVLRSERPPLDKVRWLVIAGVIGLAAGWLLGASVFARWSNASGRRAGCCSAAAGAC